MKSDYTCYSGKEVTLRMLWGTYKLDCQYFPSQIRGSLSCLFWRRRNPDIYSVVVDNATRRIVAYTAVLPITENAYEKLVSGNFIDVNLKAADVLAPDSPGDYCLYISSMVVDKTCRKGVPGLLLFRRFKERIAFYENKGVIFSKVVGDIISPDAEIVAGHFGMTCLKESSHNSKIYVGKGFSFE